MNKKIFVFYSLLISSITILSQFTIRNTIVTHQNKRPYQEDRFFSAQLDFGTLFGLYDGHGGSDTSSYLRDYFQTYIARSLKKMPTMKKTLKDAFIAADIYACQNFTDGSTATVALITDNADNKMLHLAWVGDSRAVIEKNGTVDFATIDHKPDNPIEKSRIEKAGGKVYHQGVARVNGLAISRSIGDKESKQGTANQIIAIPDYKAYQLTQDNHFMILASDGLWDVIDNEKTVAMVHNALQKKLPLDSIAKSLQDEAIKQGSEDNITICIIEFKWGYKDLIEIVDKHIESLSPEERAEYERHLESLDQMSEEEFLQYVQEITGPMEKEKDLVKDDIKTSTDNSIRALATRFWNWLWNKK